MKILIADDHALYRQGLRLALAEIDARAEIVEAADADSTLARARDDGPFDLVLLDLAMPGMNGFEGLSALRQALPAVPIVILSASESRDDVRRAIECGARGYVLKSSNPEVLRHALPLVLAGEVYLPPVLAGPEPAFAAKEQAVGRSAAPADPIAKLTPREREVLDGLVKGRSNKEIAQELALDEGTVKVHLKAVLRKLEVSNRTQAAVVAVRSGLMTAGR
ncbi:MAG: response regulator [Alphaproteobacteria bacterium]